MATYLCSQCGRRSQPDAFTQLDARYTMGKCPHHAGKQFLVREDVFAATEKKRKKHG